MQLRKLRIDTLLSITTVILAGLFFASCSSGGGTEPPPPPPAPKINSVNKTVVSPGETLVLTGENFAKPAINNTAFFNSTIFGVKPTRSTGDSLEVMVGDNANSGPMWVTSLGIKSNSVTIEVQRGVGEPWVVGQGSTFDLKLPTPTGNERYLVVPFSAQAGAVLTYPYTVTSATATEYPVPPASSASQVQPLLTFREEFENYIWDQTEAFLNSDAPRIRFEPPPARSEAAGMRTFQVLKCQCSNEIPGNFTQVTAELKYNGAHALIYADLNQPTGSYTQTDYDNFGTQFDNAIFPTDTAAFGPPTDIDSNSKVIILFSPVVNQITPAGTWQTQGFVSGFFLPNDLAPNRYSITNSAEIFYSIVPDPNNEYGNDFTKSVLLSIIPGTLAHEFEHMISFGYRYWTLGGGTSFAFSQVRWFEEGMAHMAEDLNGFDQQNVARGNLYITSPLSQISLFQGDDSLQQRGGIFLFLRYLGDRFGEDIYRDLIETACVGQGCVLAVTGKDFFEVTGDYLAALYLSDRGITNDPRYNYSSFNFQTNFASIPVATRDFGAGTFSGSVKNAAGQFWILRNGSNPAMELSVGAATGSNMRLLLVRIQ